MAGDGWATARTCLELCRVSNLPTVWTNVLTALALSGAGFAAGDFLVAAASCSLFYAGGMCLNDLVDLSYDRRRKPHRPLPEGRISRRAAAALTATLFCCALLLLLFLPFKSAAVAGLLLLLLIVAYNVLHTFHYLTVLLMGGCRMMVYVVAAQGASGTVAPPVFLAALVQWGYIIAISAVARHEHARNRPYPFPVVPMLLAGISLLDGIMMAVAAVPYGLAAGAAGAVATLGLQRFFRGD